YKRTDGVTIANNWTDLTDGALAEPLSHDEFGHEIPGTNLVWTGTASDGSSLGGNFGANDFCCDWTCNSPSRPVGVFTTPDFPAPRPVGTKGRSRLPGTEEMPARPRNTPITAHRTVEPASGVTGTGSSSRARGCSIDPEPPARRRSVAGS